MADYPISNVPRRVQYVNSGVGPYAFTFEVLVQTDIAVYRGSTLLTLTTDYTVTINANGTGSITLVAAGTGNITIVGARAIQRSSDYTTGGDLFASTLNTDLDSQTIYSQQLAESLDRTIKVPVTDASTLNLQLPNSTSRANKVFAFDSVGAPQVSTNTLAAIDAAVNTITSIAGAPSGSSAGISYIASGTGATTTTVQAKLRESASVKDFGAVGNGVTDDTGAIQTAINSGQSLYFPSGTYLCNNLTQSTNFQCFYADNNVSLIKNANGPIITSSGNNVLFQNIKFYGDSATPVFTGNNLVSSGNNLSLINCGSQWAYGRAVLATGNHVQIIGSNAIYQTADATATGFDIEIGVSGTATLYHQLIGVYTSQVTGGIKLTDTGSAVINGGQFGKLSILSGTSPAGVNGGITSNARILGNVVVGLSSAVFTGNQFSTQTITFNLGTGNHSLDTSNLTSAATIVNNGNGNSSIIKSIGTGSPAGIRLQYGQDSSNSIITYTGNNVFFDNSVVQLANNKPIQFFDSSNVAQNAINLSTGNDWTFGSDTGTGNFTNIASGDAGVYLSPSATAAFQAITSTFRPQVDGVPSLGTASQRWSVVYATTGTINTSDANQKTDIVNISAAEKRVALNLKSAMKRFKFKDAVADKGANARYHFGAIAQDVKAAFESEGLVAEKYGVFCSDILDDGSIRLGIRYEELLAFIIGAM
jgi:hypothetical protein